MNKENVLTIKWELFSSQNTSFLKMIHGSLFSFLIPLCQPLLYSSLSLSLWSSAYSKKALLEEINVLVFSSQCSAEATPLGEQTSCPFCCLEPWVIEWPVLLLPYPRQTAVITSFFSPIHPKWPFIVSVTMKSFVFCPQIICYFLAHLFN